MIRDTKQSAKDSQAAHPSSSLRHDPPEATNSGVSRNTGMGVHNSRTHAETGDPEAQYQLALSYLNGQGVTQNEEQAAFWLRKAAHQGHARAQDSLGVRYSTGEGVQQSDLEALGWFRRAAEQGYPVAQFNLALAYAQGRGTGTNLIEAYAWFCLCAEQGDTAAAGAVETLLESLSLDELKKARVLFHRLYRRFSPAASDGGSTSPKQAA